MAFASEFIPAAADAHDANFSNCYTDRRDIRLVSGPELLRSAKANHLDLLIGSPPCSSFSTAGKREKLWGKEKKYSDGAQRTDDLFEQFSRIVKETRPRAFVAENVAGMAIGKSKGVLRETIDALRQDYDVGAQILDAQWLGVPQARRRLFIVGVRRDLQKPPVFPTPEKRRISLKEACPWIGTTNDPAPDEDTSIEGYAIYSEWKRLAPGKSSERYFSLVRPALSAPCPTLTATAGSVGAASVTHPLLPRKLTVLEAKRVCGFPDDFKLTGSYQQQIERLGRAVPPPMMRAVVRRIIEEVL